MKERAWRDLQRRTFGAAFFRLELTLEDRRDARAWFIEKCFVRLIMDGS